MSKPRRESMIPGIQIKPYRGAGGEAAFQVFVTAGGRKDRQRTSRIVYGDHEEAMRVALDMRGNMRRGLKMSPRERAQLTVGHYLLYKWLPSKHKLRQTTREGYQTIIETTINPMSIGEIGLMDLEPLAVEEWLTTLRTDGRPGSLHPMTEARLLTCFRVLRAGMRQAVRWRLRSYDPTDAIEPPSPTRPIIAALTALQAEDLLAAFAGHALEPAVALGLGAGLRLGETLGLRWPNVDVDAGAARITESLRQIRGGVIVLPPKSEKSRRTVELPTWVVEILREHRRAQIDKSFDVVSGNVVKNSKGLVFHPQEAGHQFRARLESAGLPHCRFHDLRHTHATLGLDAGVELPIMSRRLGHSTLYITDSLYYHPEGRKDREAADRFDALIHRRPRARDA